MCGDRRVSGDADGGREGGERSVGTSGQGREDEESHCLPHEVVLVAGMVALTRSQDNLHGDENENENT